MKHFKELKENEEEEAVWAFGEPGEHITFKDMAIIVLKQNNPTLFDTKFSLVHRKLVAVLPTDMMLYNMSHVNSEMMELVVPAMYYAQMCMYLHRLGWIVATPKPCYITGHSDRSMELTPLTTINRWKKEVALAKSMEGQKWATQAQAGTGLQVCLAYARAAQLHIVALYVPPGSSNNAVQEHTQRVADTWIQQIVSNGHKAIVLGDFNERLADGGANVSTIGRTLMDRELFEETHRNVRRTLSEGTSVSRGGTPCSWIDFIFVTTNLGSGVCQAVVAIESTELNEDHRLIMAEVAVSLGQPGAASQAPAHRPRLNIAGASEAQQLTFLAKLDTISAADTDIDSFIWKTAEGAFQKMSVRRKAAQLKSRLCRASQMRKHVWRYMGGEDLQRWRWGKIVEECNTLITDGLPNAIREKCREVASILPPPNWEGVQKTLTNFICKHLSRTVKSEAVG
ncbi:hypothetical protein H4S03_006755 [Coemansia sp. S3946]|nr:hypothetical protein H4S03_006755 [Coemansia sp. S3946]